MSARPKSPPTTPPAIAPVLVDEPLLLPFEEPVAPDEGEDFFEPIAGR